MRTKNSHPAPNYELLDSGFRLFFLGAATFSIVATLVWMCIYTFTQHVPLYRIPAMTWHAHEMIFGYSMAVIAGFLLTAVGNWTNIQTVSGNPLLLLFLTWLAARLLPFFGETIPLQVVAVIDNLFLFFLVLRTSLPVIKVRQWNNIGIMAMLALILLSNIIFYLGVLGIWPEGVQASLYSGFYLVIALIFTFGRRVIPFFIERGVGYPVTVKNYLWLDNSSLVLFLCFWISEVIAFNSQASALLAVVLFILHSWRLAGWHTRGIWKKPMLWVLYLAYFSVIIGFVLKVLSVFSGISPFLSVHAFAYGGIGLITIGMMARISLGHTGRNVLSPPPAVFWIFILIAVGTLVRVLLPLIAPNFYLIWIGLSQIAWIVSFAIFILTYCSILIKPVISNQP